MACPVMPMLAFCLQIPRHVREPCIRAVCSRHQLLACRCWHDSCHVLHTFETIEPDIKCHQVPKCSTRIGDRALQHSIVPLCVQRLSQRSAPLMSTIALQGMTHLKLIAAQSYVLQLQTPPST